MKKVNVLMVSQYLNSGGAGRATWRIFQAMQSVEAETGVYPHLRVVRGKHLRHVDKVTVWKRSCLSQARFRARIYIDRLVSRGFFRPAEASLHSSASVKSGLLKDVEVGKWDVVNLHWLGDATVSIEEIGAVPVPILWTLHDMWPYCGAEHQTTSSRFVAGYTESNRPGGEIGPDLNRWAWTRKHRHWKDGASIVAPSEWAADKARESVLFRSASITVIPHSIDVGFWRPESNHVENRAVREGRPIRIGVGAAKGSENWGKGLDLLGHIIAKLNEQWNHQWGPWELWTFGAASFTDPARQVPTRNLGVLGDHDLRNFYQSIDVLIVPSVLETFGLVAAEAQSCGTPVVCFNRTGVTSVVENKKTGYVAEFKDVEDFVHGILWAFSEPGRLSDLSRSARTRALEEWNESRVGRLYAQVIRGLVDL